MKAYLIYHGKEAQKNKRFISLFQEAGKNAGIDFCYVNKDDYEQKALPDFVLNRTRDACVSRWYEKRQSVVFHSSWITEIGNHKGKTLAFLNEHLPPEILQTKWMPETVFLSKEKLAGWQSAILAGDFKLPSALECFQKAGNPFVIKSVDGHGGSEVMAFYPPAKPKWHDAPETYWESFNRRLNILSGKDCLVQEMVASGGRDVRVYILGNRIYQAMMRQGRGDFRSNISLGGQTQEYFLSTGEKKYVESFLQAFSGETLGLAGLDFILAEDGRMIFNELEEMAGCRMLYQNTDRDIVKDYVLWLRDFMTACL